MSDNIKVVVKVRPLISREIEDKLSYQWRVKNDTLYQLDQNGKDLGQSFTFDKVYDKDTKTTDVYDDIAKPIVQAATAGFNGTIFAYGQTSSGKTYTMTGTDSSPGIIPLAVVNLFEIIRNVPDRDFLVRVSYIEIYNETVKDLLNVDKKDIKIHESLQGIKVDATEKVTSSPEEVLEAMREGEANRQKGATNMNEESSRSHSIFQIIIESREHIEGEEEPGCVNVSQLNLVDLAGSERSGQTGATGLRFKEGTHINKSLSALALVIKQLSEDPNRFANYRNSKLTRILQNSLGGNAKTSIICAITPAAVEETISTLQFANRAKAIKNKPEVNAVVTADSTMIQRLTKQMCKLQAQLESKKNIEKDNYKLQSKIQNLQKLILNGFAQRHSVDLISGARRKLQQPRRITISSLHSIADDEPVVSIPKFCTPSLKYNPALVKADFLPLAPDCSKLAPVPEEAPRQVTPPPTRTVFFSNEIIELDSDDDDSTRDEVQTCSPVHKCYGATKTPPCILRRNAKEAERNLKGIIELTEREKMYSPNVVEYIEKLEHNTTVIAKLQDQIELMNKQSKEKDLEMEHLKSKIKQTEEAIKSLTSSKTELQAQCNNYNTRLTDAEVSYETLRNKAKLREEELLSLLEELNAKNKKPQDIGKVLSRTLDKEIQFMDISKDISLVHSDSDSIVNTNDGDHMNELLADTQSELNLRNQTIIELEANIFAQQQKISSLEDLNKNLQEEVTTFKEKLSLMDNENSLLKSTIDTLNSTIKSQKENLETANNDIESYNSVIQELQIKISQQVKLNIDDSTLENMIANEEKFIASNENMKNIIHSLKIALNSRSKEINELRTSAQINSDAIHENEKLAEQLENKTKEVDSLKKQINENIASISKLVYENNVLKTLEQDLSKKLADFELKNNELEKFNIEIALNSRSKEINELRTSAQINSDAIHENEKLAEQLENKTKEVDSLKKQINENIASISKLVYENNVLKTLEQDLSKKLADFELKNNELEKFNIEIALNSRSKEIDELRTSAQINSDAIHENEKLAEQLENKTKEVDSLKKQINENIASISKLVYENNVLKTLEQDLSKKLADFELKNNELEKFNIEITTSAERLKEENDKLALFQVDNDASEKEISQMKNLLLEEQIKIMTDKIAELEREISEKVDLISSLEKEDKESNECLLKAKAAVLKSQLILNTLSGNMQEVPEMIDNLVNVFNVLSNSMNTLENVASNVIKQKEETSKTNDDLKVMLEVLTLKHKSEISALQEQLNIFSNTGSSKSQENDTLTLSISQLNNELEKTRNELHSIKSENESLNAALEQAKGIIETCNQQIADLLDKNNVLENLTTKLEEEERILQEKLAEFTVIKKQTTNLIQERDDLLNNIFDKITDFTINYNIQNDIRGEVGNDCRKIHEYILSTLDKVGSHITFISSKNEDNDDENTKVNEILLEAKREIVELTQQNLNLIEQLSQVESDHGKLSSKLTKIQDDNEQLNKELSMSQRVLQSLQEELQMKADELTSMENRVKDWKEQFTSLDFIMKQQMDELKLENEKLKDSITDIRRKPELKPIITYEHKDSFDINNQDEADIKQSDTCGDLSSPPSLLTICCNKIVDSIQPKEIDSNTRTVSSNSDSDKSDQNNIVECKCSELSLELESIREENFEILELIQQMEAVNQHLMQEQEETRNEIQLLVEPAYELQKRIINHKTNLSILTATTTAENRALKSQVKGLQHHHSRFHNVCQRDIPDFKKQLRELMTLLKGDPSIADQQNASFKRYSLPDVLDSSTALPNFKNESTLDGDLLMLDTNITITTAADNTLTGHEQTCLDLTQFYNEASCQTNELNQTEILSHHDINMYERLNILKDENEKLRELVKKYAEMKQTMTDAQVSPIKINNVSHEHINQSPKINEIRALNECDKCKELQLAQEQLYDSFKSLSQELLDIKSQKSEIDQKYNNLILETPSTDLLVKKLNNLEKDNDNKTQEIHKLNNTLSIRTEQLQSLQEENDLLSTQVMENISEADDLNKELDNMKKINTELLEKCSKLEQSLKELSYKELSDSCSECLSKDEIIKTLELKRTKTYTKLSRSLSDSDTSSRYNKICTLQSELDAGREDCKEITEDVVTIKNHLDRSNLSMDLDDSMGESNLYTFANDYVVSSPQSNKCCMPDIPEEQPIDIYKMDKIDCFNYYAEKTGVGNENVNREIKIIDLMKTFYEHLITKHGNEVENLTNKLKDYDESKNRLESQISNLKEKHSQVTRELEQKDQNYNAVVNALSQIKNNIDILNQEIIKFSDIDVTKLVNMYKDYFFKVLDNELGLSSMKIIEKLINNIVNKHQTDLTGITEQYIKLQVHMESVTQEFISANENLEHMKFELSAKEEEYNLLKKQKERIHEISNAVTLDIVKRDKELTETINNGFKKLIELNVVRNQDVDLTLPITANIDLLFEYLFTQHKNSISPDTEKEREKLALEVKNLKQIIEVKQKEIEDLQKCSQNLQEINSAVTIDLADKETKLQAQSALFNDLNEIYESKVKENKANVDLIEKLSEEVKFLKITIDEKEKTIEKLELEIETQNDCKRREFTHMLESVKVLQDDFAQLKAMNEVIVKEKDSYATELIKSGETIKQNSIEMDKMTSDILVLRESVRENGILIENLNVEAKNLLKQNKELKEKLEDKCRECSRLETNIKTHEKTAEIQTRMIMRLEKQKNEDDKTISEKNKQIEELKLKDSQHDGNEIEHLRTIKEALEARVTELEELSSGKSRPSIDALADLSRRRRQSLHDSKRLFGEGKQEFEDHNSVEAVFESRPKPDDLFMDVDEDISNRSSPIMRHSKGRDSLSLSKTDQDEEQSRPSSVVATRRRRQSIHDMHRSVLRHTPSPGLDLSNRILDAFNHSKPSDTSGDAVSEVSHLRERLAICLQELEDLKEKYRELDEECETCAEYLRERDEQCARLKKEKAALQATVSDLKEKLQSCNPNQSQQIASKPSVAHVGVNTDEDWTNLHSVVVDRMSFDAEVEKNKKLTKTIEELRFKKQDLKNTLAKMQKALEKNSNHRELDATRHELQACKQELVQLREKYKDLDEECETCAQYLREKEEQCRRLKEAKNALETQLQEFQADHNTKSHSTRKKRQSLHDQNRTATVDVKDACTETCDDFLSYQVERDGSGRPKSENKAIEIKHLKLVVEKLTQQKTFLEQQLVSVSAMQSQQPMYVATGSAIVQNQQLTDVMKENQKLKKMNAKLVNICKKRGKDSNRENEDPADRG